MAEKIVIIPELALETIMVSIVGTTPLLTNRFSEAAIAGIKGVQEHEPTVPKGPRNPDAEFKAARHEIAPGVYGFPAGGLTKALVAAGFRFAGEKGTVLRGAIRIPCDLIPIQAPAPTMRTDTIRLPGKKGSIAYRPQFTPWRMDVPVTFNVGIISAAQVFNLFRIAGFAIGIGAWRPESDGTFGQFVLAD